MHHHTYARVAAFLATPTIKKLRKLLPRYLDAHTQTQKIRANMLFTRSSTQSYKTSLFDCIASACSFISPFFTLLAIFINIPHNVPITVLVINCMIETGTYEIFGSILNLSLIHISEPTRPY